ncbi:MAG: LysE family translocator [Demequinaceae bacterium]|nr:LysE family translocator [Demequinaceae bacterium]
MWSPEFLITALIVVLIPGTGVVFTIGVAMAHGRRAGLVAAMGCTLGIVPHILAAVLGLSALLNASAVAFQTVKYVGVAYLLFMAVQMWREARPLDVTASGDTRDSAARIVWRGVLLNLLNPKLTAFFFAFLPQFVPTDAASPTAVSLALAGVFMAMTLAVFVLYAWGAAAARGWLARRRRAAVALQRGFAVAIAGLAARLAFQRA